MTQPVLTGSYAYPSAVGMQLSVGDILKDFGEWIVTTAGEVLRTAVDQFGRRVLQKTGEVLSKTALGPATAYPYLRSQLTAGEMVPWLIGGGLLLFVLLRR